MLKVDWAPYLLKFHHPALTSRERMITKSTYFIKIYDSDDTSKIAIGECALFRGLSFEDSSDYEYQLDSYCRNFNNDNNIPLPRESSIRFGFETALNDWNTGCLHLPFISPWTLGKSSILINGLVWMGNIEQMFHRATDKIKDGFRCIKFKVGGCDFESEVKLLRRIRNEFSSLSLEIRLDANGSFTPKNALKYLDILSSLDIHSIEQPIKPRQWNELREICRKSPIPIALDEELIGINSEDKKDELLDIIRPGYIILKPSLCGGFSGANNWIQKAEEKNIGWWITSALESAVGLNAIAGWVSTLGCTIPQGLGTGQLYANDIISPLVRRSEYLYYNPSASWVFPDFDWQIEK